VISAFTYKSPTTLKDAIASLASEPGKSEVLAGGSDLLALMKDRIATPEVVVNIKNIPSLSGINVAGGKIQIGANTTLSELIEHAAVKKHLPALVSAARDLGSTQIRNVATVGGNLCQRNRDWYFRNGLHPEVKEELQYSSIFPMDGQVYVHPSTLAPVLIAYGASVTVASGVDGAGKEKTREIPIEKLFQVSDLKGKREVALAPNEIVVSVSVPVVDGTKAAEIEVRERQSHDWPLVQAAAALTVDASGTVTKASIVLGHVAPVPVRASAAEKLLIGKKLDAELAGQAGKAASEGAQTTPKNEYKTALVQVAVKRALLGAVGNEYWKGA